MLAIERNPLQIGPSGAPLAVPVAAGNRRQQLKWLIGGAACCGAAALFHPLRRRVQRAVDRRFNLARYNADLILDAFATRLQDAVDLGTVCDELASAVHAAFEPAHLSIWVREL